MIFRSQGTRASRFLAVVAALATLVLPITAGAAEKPAQNQGNRCGGNLALLVVVDSSAEGSRVSLDKSLFSALDHFGMPFQVLDLHSQALSAGMLRSHPAVIMGQNGLGKSLSVPDIEAIEDAVDKGVGLVNLDGMLSLYPAAYRKMLGVQGEKTAHTSSVRITRHGHPITRLYDPDCKYQLRKPIALTSVEAAPNAEILLTADGDLPAMFALRLGKGKIVQFTVASDFWLPDYFGHAHGLDGLFWRSIAWAARKPFVMMAMPPFVTARVDDASGSGSRFLVNSQSAAIRFRYLDTLNQFGYTAQCRPFHRRYPRDRTARSSRRSTIRGWPSSRRMRLPRGSSSTSTAFPKGRDTGWWNTIRPDCRNTSPNSTSSSPVGASSRARR